VIFECQSVCTWCDTAPAWLHGRMKCFVLDELNIDSLFNAWIYYMCFVSFVFVVGRYIKYISVHIYM
jgi:hypothetical protein